MAVTREGGGVRGLRLAVAAGACALALAAVTATASANTIDVTPGPNAITNALHSASAGDTLRIHNGTYRESFTINKRVTLNGVGGRPVIDAQCDHRATMQVFHAGVTLNHLKVTGAAANPSGPYPSEVDVENVATGTIHDVVVRDHCGGSGVGAEYGINVFNSGQVDVTGDQATGGFSDAGIYIGGITDTGSGALRVARNAAFDNHQGVIIENSAGGRILVVHNDVHDNTIGGDEGAPTGIFIHNSDTVRIRDNSVKHNGHFGVNLDSGSDHNALFDNVITGNPIDVNNDGSANCGSGNTIGSTAGTPLSTCP